MPLLRSALLDRSGFSHAFPTREASDPDLLEGLGPNVTRVLQVRQVHGAAVAQADPGWLQAAGGPVEADAVVARATPAARLAVGVRVADCVPVLVGDPATGDVAAIHAGWRGVVAGVVGRAIDALAPAGDGPRRARLVAAIGPCIGPCCFEVGREVASSVGFVEREAGDKAYVDLRAAVRAQLAAAGLESSHIEDVPGCTKHEPGRFHSFRRDGANSGRMLAAIATIRMD
jgi:YfiH family protein